MRHLALICALAAFIAPARAAPPRPVLEIAVAPEPSPMGLVVHALAHDLRARLEAPAPRRRPITLVDPGSESTATRGRVVLAPDPRGVLLTWHRAGATPSEPELFGPDRYGALADEVARRLGWPRPRPAPALEDPALAGLLLVFPERALMGTDRPSGRAIELYRRYLEDRDDTPAWSLTSDLHAAEVHAGRLDAEDPAQCLEVSPLLAALTRDAPLSNQGLARLVEGRSPGDLYEALTRHRGAGMESVWHLAAMNRSGLSQLRALASALTGTPETLATPLELRDRWGATPLIRALWAGGDDTARWLLGREARVGARTLDGVGTLHAAARSGLSGLIPVLAARLPQAALERRDARGLTPLGHAVRAPKAAVSRTVGALLSVGARVGPDAVVGACARRDLPLARALFAKVPDDRAALLSDAFDAALGLGSAVSARASWAETPEERLAIPLAFQCVAILGGRPGPDAFASALAYERPDLATSLLLLGLRADARAPHDGATLLHLAARHRQPGLIRLLAALGADAGALDDELATALEVGVEGGHVPTVNALLEVSADRVDLAAALDRAFASASEPAMFAAIVEGRWEALALTPLEAARVAVVLGDSARLEPLLVEHGLAIVAEQAPYGLGLLHLAARFGQTRLVERLVRFGEPISLEVTPGSRWHGRDLTGWTALHLAAFHGRFATYQALVTAGARSSVAADGTTPEDHLRFGGFGWGDIGAIGRAGAWSSQITWPLSTGAPNDAGIGPDEGGPFPEKLGTPPRPITEATGAAGRGDGRAPVSFVGLGGGVLLDEEPGDELRPRRATVSGHGDVYGPADGWQEQIEACLEVAARVSRRSPGELTRLDSEARERRLRALAVARGRARLLVDERARLPIGLGTSVLAAAEQSLARVELEARDAHAAEAILARAGQRQGVDGTVALALSLTTARAQRARGALAAALETLGGGPRVTGEVGARVRHWRGLWLGEAARYGEAVAALREAVAMRPDHFGTRLNLATLLGRVGAKDEARQLAEELHAQAERVASPIEAAVASFSVGLWRLSAGEGAARAMLEAALATLRQWSRGNPVVGRMALALARIELGERRHEDALRWLALARESLEESEGEEAAIIGAVDGVESEALLGLGRLEEALSRGREGYLRVIASEEPELVWPVERALARVHRARGQTGLGAAIVFGKRAVASLERIRAGVRASAPELLKGFTEDRIAVWRELANDLVRAGRYIEALAVLEGLKSDERASLVTRELVQERREPVVLPTELAPAMAASERAEREARALESTGRERELTPRERTTLSTLRATMRERRKAFEAWLVRLEEELEKMPPKRAQAIAALQLRDVSAIQGTLERLGPTVAVLHYVFADDRLRVVVTTAGGQVGRDAELGAAEVGALIVAFRELLVDPSSDPRPVARELWGQLIAPIEADLKEGGVDTLFFALDGPLRYLPMAALWDGERWLVERFKVAHLARAALDKLESRLRPTDAVAALGAAKAIPGYAPLTAVPDELEGVVKRDEADESGVMRGVIKLDEAFTREALIGLLESRRFAAYHIASHFVLTAGGEAESYLLLGDGDKLTLEDIRYELRFDGVDLLSLSACNTAVGEQTDGRELEGFASLALRLGARQVLATLWPVGDASTGRLMRELYRWQQLEGVGRAEALRLAMLGLIHDRRLTPEDKAPGLGGEVSWERCGELGGHRHPFHWAPFILIGSWL